MKKQSSTPVQDEDLWAQLLQGNKEAIELIYRRYYNQLFTYGLTIVYDKEFVRDCIQDLFVKLFRSDNLKPTLYVRAYLMRAIRNLIYDKMVISGDYLPLSHEHFMIEVDDETLNNLFSKNDADIRTSKQILQIFRQLPEQQQKVIILRFVENLSYKEISLILGINTQSCMNLVTRALKRFRQEISCAT